MGKQTTFYWTKTRKQQLLYWKILTANLFLAVTMIGAFQTYTERYVEKLSLIPTVNASNKVEEVWNQESIEEQVRRIAKEENFQWTEYLIKLMKCENLRFPEDVLDNMRDNTTGNKPKNSTDRGLFMINNYWHYEVTDAQSHDIDYSTRWTIKRINDGFQSEWMCNKIILK